MARYIVFALLAVGCGLACASDTTRASEGIGKPHQLIVDLQRRMYVVGETTGRFEDLAAAELRAAADIRRWVNGFQGFLVERNATGQLPLTVASSLGYAEIVNELLQARNVRDAIDEVDDRGLTAWAHANLALRQTAWTCNPLVFDDPLVWVPLAVTLPLYRDAVENPYRKIRRLLERAGAKSDSTGAKRFWQGRCERQTESLRAKVDATGDLLETLLTESEAALDRALAGRPRRSDRTNSAK